jgi:Tol biopolymer transport system component
VTANTGDNWHPTWSPDGRALFFITNRTGSIGLWRAPIDAETGATLGAGEVVAVPTTLIAYPRMGANGDLVYTDASADRNVHLLSLDAEKAMMIGPLRHVTRGTDFWMMPRPSPKGDWLVLARAALTEHQDVFAVRHDGDGLRRLTNDDARDGEPDISPDERRIAFESNRGGLGGIWLMNADGSDLRPLTPPSDTTAWTSPRWSPDGRTIAARQQPGNRVVLFDADRVASPPRAMLPIPSELRDGTALLPLSMARLAWSADGRQLAARFDGLLTLYAMDRDTYRTAEVGGAIVGWPRGPFIVLDQWGERRLAVLDTRSWQIREIPYSPHLQRDDRLMLSADGRTLAFDRGTYHADIWLMRSSTHR